MKKISLTIIGSILLSLASFSQKYYADTSGYKSEKLTLEEVNLVSGYYSQNGNHSAVTGGVGSEKLTDISNILELKFVKWNATEKKKYTLDIEGGIDHHTAASQAYISKTGASSPNGNRLYPSLNWQVENPNGTNFGIGGSYSYEYNYRSIGANISFGIKSKNGSTDLQFKGQAYIDQVALIQPSELSTQPIYSISGSSRGRDRGENIPTSPRNTYTGSLTLSQIVNKALQFSIIAEPTQQTGLLSLPFHRVYFTNGSMKVENLPSQRQKFPIGFRACYFIGDKLVSRIYYRYYEDNWGVKANTISLELPYKLSPFVSIAPFVRLYEQSAANYFAPYKQHLLSEKYYTSNYELSKLQSKLMGINLRFSPKTSDFIFDMIEIRFSHYTQTTGLNANNIGLNVRFK